MPGDYFDTTYQGSYKSGLALGQGLESVAGDVAGNIKQDKQRKQAFDMLKQFGMIDTKTEEPSLDELAQGAKDFVKQTQGPGHDLQINYGDNPEQAKQNIMGIYKALNIPMPQGKKTIRLNLAPGTKADLMKGDVEFSNPKSLLSQIGMDNIPQGMQVVGYDQKGQPMVRKIQRDIQGEKLDIEKQEKQKFQEENSKMVLDTANDTLNTITDVEKGIDNFGTFGNIPSFPGTSRKTWEANIDKLLSGKILKTIQTMKEASKTGATGFGQLNAKELKVLENASTALKKDLPKEDAVRYINDMKSSVQKIINNKSEESNQLEDAEYQKYLKAIGQ